MTPALCRNNETTHETQPVVTAQSVAIGTSTLGSVLVAATGTGISAIELGDTPDALIHSFQKRFDAAELAATDPRLERLVLETVRLIETSGNNFDWPLDMCGTPFQKQVWQALQRIPAGSTTSYTEIATDIGRPGAARAVASACAANPIAVAVPCHRVVRGDGALAGYRWGIERKRELLKREAARL